MRTSVASRSPRCGRPRRRSTGASATGAPGSPARSRCRATERRSCRASSGAARFASSSPTKRARSFRRCGSRWRASGRGCSSARRIGGRRERSTIRPIAESAQAIAEIWRYLLDVDWVATIETSLLPPDHPLFFVLAEPRRMRYRMGDSLWARLVDVGAALSLRTYADDGELVLDLRDAFCPWNEGRWLLAGGTAERTDREPDLRLDVRELGSAYLGGVGFVQLAQSGLVEEVAPGALARADRIFRHGLQPWCPEIF